MSSSYQSYTSTIMHTYYTSFLFAPVILTQLSINLPFLIHYFLWLIIIFFYYWRAALGSYQLGHGLLEHQYCTKLRIKCNKKVKTIIHTEIYILFSFILICSDLYFSWSPLCHSFHVAILCTFCLLVLLGVVFFTPNISLMLSLFTFNPSPHSSLLY